MPLFSLSYWTNLQAQELAPSVQIALLVVFGGLTVLGIIAALLAWKKTGSMFWVEGGGRFSKIALWMGVIGLLFLVSTHELAYFFGARFWYLVWLVVFIILIARWIKFCLMDIPEKRMAYEEKARIDKWLPKHKK